MTVAEILLAAGLSMAGLFILVLLTEIKYLKRKITLLEDLCEIRKQELEIYEKITRNQAVSIEILKGKDK